MATLMEDVLNLLRTLPLYDPQRVSEEDASVIRGKTDTPPTYEPAAVVIWTRNTRHPRGIGDTANTGGDYAIRIIDADPIIPGQTDDWISRHRERRAVLEAALTMANLAAANAPVVRVTFNASRPEINLLADSPYFVESAIDIERPQGSRRT